MRPVDLTPITPQLNSSASGGAGDILAQLLKGGRPVNLEVLKALSTSTTLFKTPAGSLTLETPASATFRPGSHWLLQADAETGAPVLTAADQKQPVKAANQTSQTVAVKIAPTTDTTRPTTGKVAVENGQPSTRSPEITENKPQAPQHLKGNKEPLQPLLVEHRRTASLKQNSLSGLFSSTRTLTQNTLPQANQNAPLQQLAKLAEKIEAIRVPQRPDASSVRNAVRSSGIFHEAGAAGKAANTHVQSGGGAGNTTSLLAVQGEKQVDLKGVLQDVARLARTSNITPQSAPRLETPPPPLREENIQGHRPAPILSNQIVDDGLIARFFDQAVEGLARLKLLQLASLPTGESDATQAGDKARMQLHLEIPVAVSQEQTAIVGLRISGEGNGNASEEQHAHGWSVEISVDTDETGPVDAFVRFGAGGVRADIWAGQKEFADRLKSGSERLEAYLAEEGFEVGGIEILHGRRPDPARHLKHNAGYYLDRGL